MKGKKRVHESRDYPTNDKNYLEPREWFEVN